MLDEVDGDDELIDHATTITWSQILYPDASLPLHLPPQAQILSR
ncbi:hypothetical protein [Sphingomonas sp. Root720]|nr:hypothetical protein [Sphingomonas sp. Root720]